MKKEVQEEMQGKLSGKFTVNSAKQIGEEEDTDSESSSNVSEKSRKGSLIGNRQIGASSLAYSRCPTPESEINRAEYREIERKGQHTDEEQRLEYLFEQMTLEERQKMEQQKAIAEPGGSYPLTADIRPTPVTCSPPKPTCSSNEAQEQVTGCESKTLLQLSGITTNSCIDVCHQLDYIEDTLHSLKNQQEGRKLNHDKSKRHSECQQESLSRRRRQTQEPTETRRMMLRSGKVLRSQHNPNNRGSDPEDDDNTPKLMFSTGTKTSGSTDHGPSVT